MISETTNSEGKRQVVIKLPFKLPTWNRILGMGHWQRKQLRDSIHKLVSIYCQSDTDSVTPMESQQRQLLMDSYMKLLSPTIAKKKSVKSLTVKKRSRKIFRKKRS